MSKKQPRVPAGGPKGGQWTSPGGGGGRSATTSHGDYKSPDPDAAWRLRQMAAQMGSGAEDDPHTILGSEIPPKKVTEYLKKNGAVIKQGSPLPTGVPRGEAKQCYTNASQLVTENTEKYDYAEGFAYAPGVSGLAFQHAWAVDRKTGAIVDPTWDNPEKARYFGITYDWEKYRQHILSTEMYGVLGGDWQDAIKVVERGGL